MIIRLLRWLLALFRPTPEPPPVVEPSPPVVVPSPPVVTPPVVTPLHRTGIVRLDGRAFADDDGPFVGWGASLFWALWAARHDEPKLNEALDWLSSHGVDYVRVLSMVGSQPYWDGRIINPSWDDYAEVLFRLLDACQSRGLRVQMTLFADAQVMMPRQQDRLAWVETMAVRLESRRPTIQFVEIANESNLNGVDDSDLAELTRHWTVHSGILVAPSSPDGGNAEESIQRLFSEHSAINADLLTPHLDRRINTVEGRYRPIRQPWEVQFYNTPTTVFTNNEPIGPGSSGETETDPGRLAAGMLTTYIAGGASYVLHSDAGVRGDISYPDAVSDDAMRAMRAVHGLVPGDIASGQRQNHHWDGHPYETADQIWPDTDGTGVVRAFATEVNHVFWIILMGLRDKYDMIARWDMTIESYDLRTGEWDDAVTLDVGDTWTFYALHDDAVSDLLHKVTRR